MSDMWGRHEVERLLSLAPLSEDGRWSPKNDALIFFKNRVDYEVMMSLLVREWRRIEGVKNYFDHERARLVEAAAKNAPNAERIRVLLEDMRTAMLETREKGIKDRTGPSLKIIAGAEGARDFLQAYPAKTKAFVAVFDLTLKEIESVDRMQRESIGRFAWESVPPSRAFARRAHRGSDRPSDRLAQTPKGNRAQLLQRLSEEKRLALFDCNSRREGRESYNGPAGRAAHTLASD